MYCSQVGWANASLRYPEELPELPAPGKGVVLEDPLESGFSPGVTLRPAAGRSHHSNSTRPSGGVTSENSAGAGLERAGSVGSGPAEMEVLTGPAPRRRSLEVQLAQSEIVKEPHAHVRTACTSSTL